MRVLLAVIAALVIVALACSDGNGGEATPTSTARPLSTPTPVIAATPTAALPVPEWIPAALFGEARGQQFIADTVSGVIWQLKNPGERRPSQIGSRFAAWLPDGEALVTVTDGQRTTLYRGAPGEPLRETSTLELSTSSAIWHSAGWSSNGELLARASGLITDMKTGDIIAELEEPSWKVIGWSADGRYLAFVVGTGSERGVLVWERDSGLTERISTWSAVWSGTGARLAYGPRLFPDPAQTGPFEVRVRDFNAGTYMVVDSRDTRQSQKPVAWSADGRFLAISLYVDGYQTLMIDTSGERSEVLVPGAEPHAWLGTSHTLLLTGDMCGASARFDVVTVESDGSGLRNYTDSPDFELYPRASPNGRLVAFAASRPENLSEIRLLTLATGEITILAAGPAITLFENVIDPAIVWSPDSRYVVFGVTDGHGIC